MHHWPSWQEFAAALRPGAADPSASPSAPPERTESGTEAVPEP